MIDRFRGEVPESFECFETDRSLMLMLEPFRAKWDLFEFRVETGPSTLRFGIGLLKDKLGFFTLPLSWKFSPGAMPALNSVPEVLGVSMRLIEPFAAPLSAGLWF